MDVSLPDLTQPMLLKKAFGQKTFIKSRDKKDWSIK